jgi:hypothetical protein
MGSTPTDWVTLALTTLGGGAVGSIVTTYTSQTRERRQARSDAREAITRAEKVAFLRNEDAFHDALETLETKAMLAGMPRHLTTLYRKARESQLYYEARSGVIGKRGKEHVEEEISEANKWLTGGMLAAGVATEAVQLFINATWHPWHAAPWRWYRARKLGLMLEGTAPVRIVASPEFRRITKSRRRELIKEGKRARKERRLSGMPRMGNKEGEKDDLG